MASPPAPPLGVVPPMDLSRRAGENGLAKSVAHGSTRRAKEPVVFPSLEYFASTISNAGAKPAPAGPFASSLPTGTTAPSALPTAIECSGSLALAGFGHTAARSGQHDSEPGGVSKIQRMPTPRGGIFSPTSVGSSLGLATVEWEVREQSAGSLTREDTGEQADLGPFRGRRSLMLACSSLALEGHPVESNMSAPRMLDSPRPASRRRSSISLADIASLAAELNRKAASEHDNFEPRTPVSDERIRPSPDVKDMLIRIRQGVQDATMLGEAAKHKRKAAAAATTAAEEAQRYQREEEAAAAAEKEAREDAAAFVAAEEAERRQWTEVAAATKEQTRADALAAAAAAVPEIEMQRAQTLNQTMRSSLAPPPFLSLPPSLPPPPPPETAEKLAALTRRVESLERQMKLANADRRDRRANQCRCCIQ